MWQPSLTKFTGENGAPLRRAASSEAADLLADLVAEDVRTLAFIRSRRGAEQVAITAAGLLAEVDPSLPAQGRRLPRRLPARGAPRARAPAPGRRADRAGGHQRARARHRRQRPRRRAAGRVPGHPRGVLAAGRPGRPGCRRRPRDPGRSRRPARHLPRHPPRGPARPAGRGDGLRPDQPLRPRPAPVRRGGRAAADRGRPADVRPDRPRRRRPADPGRAAAAPLARLVLDRPAAGQRPRRHPLERRPSGRAGRGRDRPRDRHRRLRQRALDRARRRGLRPPRRDLAGRVARPRRARRRDRPGRPGRTPPPPARPPTSRSSPSRTTAPGATAGCRSARSTSPTRSCPT